MKELRKAAALAASNEIKSNPSTLMIKQREDLRDVEILGEEEWGGIKLHVLLQKALLSLNFNLPTADLIPGTYLIRIKNGNLNWQHQITKQ